MAQWVKPRPRKKRTNSCRMPSDRHMFPMARAHMHIHINKCKRKIEFVSHSGPVGLLTNTVSDTECMNAVFLWRPTWSFSQGGTGRHLRVASQAFPFL